MLVDEKFGKASKKVVIEEFLNGIELSCFILSDGQDGLTLPMAKDYKRIGEGDSGLNTGGMGAVSPVPFVDKDFRKKIDEKIKNKLIYKEADLLSYLWSYKKGPNGPIFLYYLLDQVIANWNARINKTNLTTQDFID